MSITSSSIRCLLMRLAVKDRDGVAVEPPGALVAVTDADGAKLAVLGERPDQVEHDPLLGCPVEVEAVVHSYIYQIVRGQALVGRALEVVRGVVVARLRGGRAVGPVLRVVGPIGQEPQYQVG